nr:E3 ubiquitin-protein ligase AIRP2 [Ipomoea batatas]
MCFHLCIRALGHRRELDGACIQMRLAYSPASQFCLFLLQWFDCKVAGALGLLEVLVYMAYADGKTSMYIKERRASIREFYEIIFPSLQIQRGITDFEEMKQKEICSLRYSTKGKLSEIELEREALEREAECGICLEPNSKVVMPDCRHSLCLRCFQEWRSRSQSCPFCRSNLRRVNSDDLWVCMEKSDTVELPLILREDWKRLYRYIENLPIILPDPRFTPYGSHLR